MKHYLANIEYQPIHNQHSHKLVFKFEAAPTTDLDQLQNIMEGFSKSFSHLNVVASEVCQIQFETFRALPPFIRDLAIPEQDKTTVGYIGHIRE